MKYYGGSKLGDRTLIDALQPALEVLMNGCELSIAADAARIGAEASSRRKKSKCRTFFLYKE